MTRLPMLAPDACVHPPVDAEDVWVAQVGTRYLRVGADAGRLLSAMDGTRDAAGLAVALGAPWTAEVVTRSLTSFVRMGLIVDAADPAAASAATAATAAGRRRRLLPFLPALPTLSRTAPNADQQTRRLVYRPPLSVQFTLTDPSRLLSRWRPMLRRLTGPAACGLYLAVIVVGLCALATQADSLRQVVGHPLGLTQYGVVLGGLLLVTGIHEMGHAAVLTAHGGRPRRLGIMLFYLTPAFFCDISDGWRLRHPRHRVAIALAGIAVQWVCAGLAAIISLALPAGDLHDAVVGLAVACYLYGVVNLVPFVKFDGYIALMSHLDLPHLRRKAMTDARRATARVLFGGTYQRELPRRLWWSVPFGVLCALFPVYLVGYAVQSWLVGLVAMGPVGGLVSLLLIGAMVVLIGRSARNLFVEARGGGATVASLVLVSSLVAGLVVAAAVSITVPSKVRAGYSAEHGRVLLVLPAGTDPAAGRAGHPVTLRRMGLLGGADVGTARTSGESVHTGERFAPMGTALPVRGGPRTLSASYHGLSGVRLTDADAGRAGASGQAIVDLGKVSAARWLVDTYLAPAWRSIVG
ncbi:daptide biosynthesis intramembrane metalloprotease [Frankia canadensis]|uniref:daptide biosynthesis intramembrane metalloprotease n=1 Tax=Frankia canadensis TaxID=1836972 RepID=UPI001A9CAEE9|nr:daptide biosynthesis intramembrane metalloprotease [Frankia canadensis]